MTAIGYGISVTFDEGHQSFKGSSLCRGLALSAIMREREFLLNLKHDISDEAKRGRETVKSTVTH